MQFPIISADPAWNYRDAAPGKRGLAKNHYPTMSLAQIKAMRIAELADPTGAALFLWVTYPLLDEGIEVLRAWGFQYKTVAFTWVKVTATGKPCFGMGNWTRSNPEIVLLGTRGKIRRECAAVPNVLFAPRMKHSQKPPEIGERIVRLMGDKPRLELFARRRTPGWHVWGNEVESDVEISSEPLPLAA